MEREPVRDDSMKSSLDNETLKNYLVCVLLTLSLSSIRRTSFDSSTIHAWSILWDRAVRSLVFWIVGRVRRVLDL
jgi:hypothetical protein